MYETELVQSEPPEAAQCLFQNEHLPDCMHCIVAQVIGEEK
jgi:hypothetical protein